MESKKKTSAAAATAVRNGQKVNSQLNKPTASSSSTSTSTTTKTTTTGKIPNSTSLTNLDTFKLNQSMSITRAKAAQQAPVPAAEAVVCCTDTLNKRLDELKQRLIKQFRVEFVDSISYLIRVEYQTQTEFEINLVKLEWNRLEYGLQQLKKICKQKQHLMLLVNKMNLNFNRVSNDANSSSSTSTSSNINQSNDLKTNEETDHNLDSDTDDAAFRALERLDLIVEIDKLNTKNVDYFSLTKILIRLLFKLFKFCLNEIKSLTPTTKSLSASTSASQSASASSQHNNNNNNNSNKSIDENKLFALQLVLLSLLADLCFYEEIRIQVINDANLKCLFKIFSQMTILNLEKKSSIISSSSSSSAASTKQACSMQNTADSQTVSNSKSSNSLDKVKKFWSKMCRLAANLCQEKNSRKIKNLFTNDFLYSLAKCIEKQNQLLQLEQKMTDCESNANDLDLLHSLLRFLKYGSELVKCRNLISESRLLVYICRFLYKYNKYLKFSDDADEIVAKTFEPTVTTSIPTTTTTTTASAATAATTTSTTGSNESSTDKSSFNETPATTETTNNLVIIINKKCHLLSKDLIKNYLSLIDSWPQPICCEFYNQIIEGHTIEHLLWLQIDDVNEKKSITSRKVELSKNETTPTPTPTTSTTATTATTTATTTNKSNSNINEFNYSLFSFNLLYKLCREYHGCRAEFGRIGGLVKYIIRIETLQSLNTHHQIDTTKNNETTFKLLNLNEYEKLIEVLCFSCKESINRFRLKEHGYLNYLVKLQQKLKSNLIEKDKQDSQACSDSTTYNKLLVAMCCFAHDQDSMNVLLSNGLIDCLLSFLNDSILIENEKNTKADTMSNNQTHKADLIKRELALSKQSVCLKNLLFSSSTSSSSSSSLVSSKTISSNSNIGNSSNRKRKVSDSFLTNSVQINSNSNSATSSSISASTSTATATSTTVSSFTTTSTTVNKLTKRTKLNINSNNVNTNMNVSSGLSSPPLIPLPTTAVAAAPTTTTTTTAISKIQSHSLVDLTQLTQNDSNIKQFYQFQTLSAQQQSQQFQSTSPTESYCSLSPTPNPFSPTFSICSPVNTSRSNSAIMFLSSSSNPNNNNNSNMINNGLTSSMSNIFSNFSPTLSNNEASSPKFNWLNDEQQLVKNLNQIEFSPSIKNESDESDREDQEMLDELDVDLIENEQSNETPATTTTTTTATTTKKTDTYNNKSKTDKDSVKFSLDLELEDNTLFNDQLYELNSKSKLKPIVVSPTTMVSPTTPLPLTLLTTSNLLMDQNETSLKKPKTRMITNNKQASQLSIESINRTEACVLYVLSQLSHGDKPSMYLFNNFESILICLLNYLKYAKVRNPRALRILNRLTKNQYCFYNFVLAQLPYRIRSIFFLNQKKTKSIRLIDREESTNVNSGSGGSGSVGVSGNGGVFKSINSQIEKSNNEIENEMNIYLNSNKVFFDAHTFFPSFESIEFTLCNNLKSHCLSSSDHGYVCLISMIKYAHKRVERLACALVAPFILRNSKALQYIMVQQNGIDLVLDTLLAHGLNDTNDLDSSSSLSSSSSTSTSSKLGIDGQFSTRLKSILCIKKILSFVSYKLDLKRQNDYFERVRLKYLENLSNKQLENQLQQQQEFNLLNENLVLFVFDDDDENGDDDDDVVVDEDAFYDLNNETKQKKTICANRNFLSLQSDYFNALLNGHFCESVTTTHTNITKQTSCTPSSSIQIIKIEDISYEAFEIIIDLLNLNRLDKDLLVLKTSMECTNSNTTTTTTSSNITTTYLSKLNNHNLNVNLCIELVFACDRLFLIDLKDLFISIFVNEFLNYSNCIDCFRMSWYLNNSLLENASIEYFLSKIQSYFDENSKVGVAWQDDCDEYCDEKMDCSNETTKPLVNDIELDGFDELKKYLILIDYDLENLCSNSDNPKQLVEHFRKSVKSTLCKVIQK